MTDPRLTPRAGRFRYLRIMLGVGAVLVGLVLVVAASTLGHCSAFGGTCPADPPPLLDDDVFGMGFSGGLVAVGLPIWLAKPGWRRLGFAASIAIPTALVIGLMARSAAAG